MLYGEMLKFGEVYIFDIFDFFDTCLMIIINYPKSSIQTSPYISYSVRLNIRPSRRHPRSRLTKKTVQALSIESTESTYD